MGFDSLKGKTKNLAEETKELLPSVDKKAKQKETKEQIQNSAKKLEKKVRSLHTEVEKAYKAKSLKWEEYLDLQNDLSGILHVLHSVKTGEYIGADDQILLDAYKEMGVVERKESISPKNRVTELPKGLGAIGFKLDDLVLKRNSKIIQQIWLPIKEDIALKTSRKGFENKHTFFTEIKVIKMPEPSMFFPQGFIARFKTNTGEVSTISIDTSQSTNRIMVKVKMTTPDKETEVHEFELDQTKCITYR